MNSSGIVAEIAQSEEERQERQKIEQLKRQGYNYFRVVYRGRLPFDVIKLQGLKAIEAYRATDDKTGMEIWRARPGSDPYFFWRDSQGQVVTDVWDDPDQYNRFYMERHTGRDGSEFEIEDKQIAKEIRSLRDKPFKAELSEAEQLLKDREEIDRRLARLQKTSPPQLQEPTKQKRKGHPLSEEHKQKMAEGRRRAREQKAAQPQEVAQGA
jgi:hypothetical protein